jgi:hypothetical protein
MDALGNQRIVLKVPANGEAEMDFLDKHGKVIKVFRGEDSGHSKS